MLLNLSNNLTEDRRRLMGLPLSQLEQLMKYYGNKRYVEQDVSVEREHRLVSSVYIQRTRTSESLIFHLKNFCVNSW